MNEKLIILILFGVLFGNVIAIPLAKAQEGQVTINPINDTYVDSDNINSNYGGQDYLIVSHDYNEYLGESERIAWLKFNLSDVPDGAIVDSATLELYTNSVSETYTVYAHYCADNSWTELTLTYNNMPNFNVTPIDSTIVSSSFEWYNWEVTNAVKNTVNGIHGGPGVLTIVLQEITLRSWLSSVYFFSNETWMFARQPKLTIHWNDIIPEFPILAPTLVMMLIITAVFSFYKIRVRITF